MTERKPSEALIRVLEIILEQPKASHYCTQVAESAGVSPGAVHGILMRLHREGRLARERRPGDMTRRVYYTMDPESVKWARRTVKAAAATTR